MMFRVRWERRALNELTSLWTNANSAQRQLLTSASHAIEKLLQVNPTMVGESRSQGRRIVFIQPFAFLFQVEAEGQTVSILQVRMFRQRNP